MLELKEFYDKLEKNLMDKKTLQRLELRMKKSVSLMKEPHETVLDVGCKDGILRKYLSQSTFYVGVGITRKWWDGTFEFVVAEATKLPFKDNSFDNVVALELIEHLFNYSAFIKEAYRILKDDGFLILSTPNIACLLNRFKLLFGKMPSYFGINSGHLHCFTYDSLCEVLHPLFKVTKRGYTYTLFPLRRLTSRIPLLLLKLVARLFPNLSDHILVRAEKCRK